MRSNVSNGRKLRRRRRGWPGRLNSRGDIMIQKFGSITLSKQKRTEDVL
jgi:hypothetical protein